MTEPTQAVVTGLARNEQAVVPGLARNDRVVR